MAISRPRMTTGAITAIDGGTWSTSGTVGGRWERATTMTPFGLCPLHCRRLPSSLRFCARAAFCADDKEPARQGHWAVQGRSCLVQVSEGMNLSHAPARSHQDLREVPGFHSRRVVGLPKRGGCGVHTVISLDIYSKQPYIIICILFNNSCICNGTNICILLLCGSIGARL